MKIFEKDGWIFIQMMDMTSMEMLIDFSIEKESFNELRDHIIEHLLSFKIEGEKVVGQTSPDIAIESPESTSSKPSNHKTPCLYEDCPICNPKEGSNKAIETYLKMLEIRLSQRMRL